MAGPVDEVRKLATIMSVDVAGYSRMAEADDSQAASAVVQLKAALARIAEPLSGRVFNTAGDGVMLEFPVASAGVEAASQLLAEATGREGALPLVRIGLHVGEVLVLENGDLLGHGVNVAARLQALAAPRTAVMSASVHAQVRGAMRDSCAPKGRVRLDKMNETVDVFALAPQGEEPTTSRAMRLRQIRRGALMAAPALAAVLLTAYAFGGFWRPVSQSETPKEPRLAVLKFETVEGVAPYFAEGLADELISEMSRIKGMEVTARASSFALTGARASPGNAARELGATLVLTGSVRRMHDTIRVHASLAEAAQSGRQIWSDVFERPFNEVYALQRDIAVRVARETGLRTESDSSRPVDPEAFDLYLRAQRLAQSTDGSPQDFAKIRDLLRDAVDRDATFARAWAALAAAELNLAMWGEPAPQGVFSSALGAAEHAIAIDPAMWEPFGVKASVAVILGNWRDADVAAEAVTSRGGLAPDVYCLTGRNRICWRQSLQQMERDPLSVRSTRLAISPCIGVGDFGCAKATANRALAMAPSDPVTLLSLLWLHADLGDTQSAQRLLDEHAGPLKLMGARFAYFDQRFFKSFAGQPASVSDVADAAAKGRTPAVFATLQLMLTGREADVAVNVLPHWTARDRHALNVLFHPRAAALRRSAQFWALMEREGLAKYWRESGRHPDFCRREACAPLR